MSYVTDIRYPFGSEAEISIRIADGGEKMAQQAAEIGSPLPMRGYQLGEHVYLKIGPVMFSGSVLDEEDATSMIRFATRLAEAVEQFAEAVKAAAQHGKEKAAGLSPDGAGASVEAYRG